MMALHVGLRRAQPFAGANRPHPGADPVHLGEADDTVGRIVAEGTTEFIQADYRFVPLPCVGHYAADQVPAEINKLLLDHLARHPV
jgi:hypothetical protein